MLPKLQGASTMVYAYTPSTSNAGGTTLAYVRVAPPRSVPTQLRRHALTYYQSRSLQLRKEDR